MAQITVPSDDHTNDLGKTLMVLHSISSTTPLVYISQMVIAEPKQPARERPSGE